MVGSKSILLKITFANHQFFGFPVFHNHRKTIYGEVQMVTAGPNDPAVTVWRNRCIRICQVPPIQYKLWEKPLS
jgi:hypothetical protein